MKPAAGFIALPLVLITFASVQLAGTAHAGMIDPPFESYLRTLPDDAKVSILIMMADQAPISNLDTELREERAPLAERHAAIITSLIDKAAATQGPLLTDLAALKATGEVAGYTPYWIANLVVAKMTVRTLRVVAARADVGTVYSNFTVSPMAAPMVCPELGGSLAIQVPPGLRAINAPRVWYELGFNGSGRLVGGLDSGVTGTHVALSARWRGAQAGVPWQHAWLDRLGTNTQSPVDADVCGHGTHTMGTMVGLGAATHDTVGVAWGAQWIACNAIGNPSTGAEFDNDVIAAFQWFADPDGNPQTTADVPDVVENSWRINEDFPGGYIDCDPRWWAVMDGCEAAGCAVVFSAGNEGPGAETIGSPPDRITTPTDAFAIGAVNATDFQFPYPIANFSSRGPSGCNHTTIKPEVSAPGVTVYSTTRNGGYGQFGWSGTSMAGPHVSGTIALMRQANPNIDVTTAKQILMRTARDEGAAGEDNSYGWGVIDAYNAVRQAQCDDPLVLASGAAAITPAPGGFFTFTQSPIYWSAAAVRNPVADWDIAVFSSGTGGSGDNCFSGVLASSSNVNGADFVIGDFNHNPLGSYYVYSHRYSGPGSAVTEWDDGPDALTINAPAITRNTGSNDVIEVWDVFLDGGTTYTFDFNRVGSADTRMMLFRNPGATYWVGRNSRVLETTVPNTYTAPASDWYGVVVVNDNGQAGTYSLRVGTCTAPVALASGVSVITPPAVGYYSFNQNNIYWTAVGVRQQSGDDWDLTAYQQGSGGAWPSCFSNPLASSTGVSTVDFVIGDFNHNPIGTYYVSPFDFYGMSGRTEWDDGANQLFVGDPPISRATGESDVLEVWDVLLSAGVQYDIFFERTRADDTKLLLFKSENGIYWAPRSAAQLETQALHTLYPAPVDDWYGIVVVNDTGLAGDYRLGISVASTAVNDPGPSSVPAATALGAPRPNPAAGSVQIAFDLHERGAVDLEILDVAGRVVAALPSRSWEPGSWQAPWDGRGRNGDRVPAGVYWVRMAAGAREIGRSKFILLK